MTTPSDLNTDSAAEVSGMTVSIIKDQALGSFITMGRIVGPFVAAALALALLAFIAYAMKRALTEAKAGRQTLDPRPLVDPHASDVLGEW